MHRSLSPNGIQAVFFDLDGTLRHDRPPSSKTFFDFAVEMGLAESQEGRRKALRWAHYYFADSPELRADRERIGDSRDEFWRNYARRHLTAFGCPPAQAEELAAPLRERMAHEYQPEDWIPPDVPVTLEALQGAGFTLAVVSNRSEPVDAYLETLGLGHFFSFSLTAGQVAAWKPDVRIFQRALEDAEARPEQAVYVGDNYYADVLGSRRAGLQPVLIDPDGLFPQAACPVIQRLGEFPGLMATWRQD